MTKLRKRLYDNEAEFLGLKLKPHDKGRQNAKYSITKEEWKAVNEFRNNGIVNASINVGVDHSSVKHLWHEVKDEDGKKKGNLFIKNPLYKEQLEKDFNELLDGIENRIGKICKNSIKRSKIKPKIIESDYLFDLCVFTDAHIGMEVNPNGFSLYGGKWDANELNRRKHILIDHTITTKKANRLVVFDLGDLMDGWDGETVRKGHKLPQNMTNEEAFDVALEFKIGIIDGIVNQYEEIDIININDDNHSGAFSYVVNSAFKTIIEQRYGNVKVINQRKFIDHYIYNNKVFVATHGKDGKNLKFGFKPILNPVQIEKIENYLFENELVNKKYDVYFIKGDSHQDILDNSTSQKFKYWNFPAFSPSSNWVQTNFKKGISGFYNFNFKDKNTSQHPYYFD